MTSNIESERSESPSTQDNIFVGNDPAKQDNTYGGRKFSKRKSSQSKWPSPQINTESKSERRSRSCSIENSSTHYLSEEKEIIPLRHKRSKSEASQRALEYASKSFLSSSGRRPRDLGLNINELKEVYQLQESQRLLHSYLMRIHADRESNYELTLNDSGHFQLVCGIVKKGNSFTRELIEAIFKSTFDKVTPQNAHFISDDGGIYSTHHLLQLLNKKYGRGVIKRQEAKENELRNQRLSPFLQNDMAEESEYIQHLLDLPLPEKFSRLPSNEIACVKILQRLYPISSRNVMNKPGIMPPLLFLSSYRSFVSMEQLLELARKTLSLPETEMPYHQKLRTLNLFRVGLEFRGDNSTDFKGERFKKALFSLVQKAKKLADNEGLLEMGLLAEQIYTKFYLLEENESFLMKGVVLRKTKVFTPSRFNIGEFPQESEVNFIVEEIHSICGRAFLSLDPMDFFQENDPNKLQKTTDAVLFNQLGLFVANTFIEFGREYKALQFTKEKKRILLASLFSCFIDIAWKLTELNDFHASLAIYSMLNRSEIFNIFKANDSKKRAYPSHAVIDKKLFPKETRVKLEQLQALLLPSQQFFNLKMRYRQLEKELIPYIPYTGMIKQLFIYQKEEKELAKRTLSDSEVGKVAHTFENGMKLEDFVEKALPALGFMELQKNYHDYYKKKKPVWFSQITAAVMRQRPFEEDELDVLMQ